MSDELKSLTLKEWAFGTEAEPYTLPEVDERTESLLLDGSDQWEAVKKSRLRATVKALERAKIGEQVAYENYRNAADELARVAAERDAARAEARAQNIACAEEMLNRDHMQQNWDAVVSGTKFAHERAEKAEATVLQLRQAIWDAVRMQSGVALIKSNPIAAWDMLSAVLKETE
jgi:hypothetical protein